MRPLARLLASILLLGALPAYAAARPACDRVYSLALHDHGLLYSPQTGEGIDKDIADELIRRSGCRFAVTLMPRARIWQLIESGTLDFSLTGITNDTRDGYAAFAWYVSNKYYLLVRKDAGVDSVADFESRPALKLGVIRAFRYSPSANRMVDHLDAEHRVSFATDLAPLYQVLLQNRLQAMIIEPFDYPTISESGIREQTKIVQFDDPAIPHGLIMSRKSLSPEQQQAWRTVVDGMRTDGTMERIFAKYFPADLARAMTQF